MGEGREGICLVASRTYAKSEEGQADTTALDSRDSCEGRGRLSLFLQSVLNGTLMGIVYALIALGLSIVFGVMNLSNFAHGEFVMLAMYATYWVAVLGGVDAVLTPILTIPLMFVLVYVA